MKIYTSIGIFGTLTVVMALPYENEEIRITKKIAWLIHTSTFGTILAPLSLFGSGLLVRATIYTAAAISGLSIIAATAPSEQFLVLGGILAMFLNLVCAVSISKY